ncbi:MAG: sugar transferase [Sedimentisphaerales bacterium]|nr:sugar transferase [Sedimentisphaerales bacterium]
MTNVSRALKRGFDILAVLAACPLLLPLVGAIWLALRLSAGSPVIFRQERAGKDMKSFTFYKFRTMRSDVDPYGPSPRSGSDPRLTPLGRWLRLTSLDELPQLWNVLRGDMSLVGPRPLYLEQARQWNEHQRRRLEVKPGLTGLAQIRGRASLTIEEKIDLDVQYVQRLGLWLDARILLATVVRLLSPRHIYEKRYSRDRDTWNNDKPIA